MNSVTTSVNRTLVVMELPVSLMQRATSVPVPQARQASIVNMTRSTSVSVILVTMTGPASIGLVSDAIPFCTLLNPCRVRTNRLSYCLGQVKIMEDR